MGLSDSTSVSQQPSLPALPADQNGLTISGRAPDVGQEGAPFPLTPALSLWERVNPRQRCGGPDPHGLAAFRGVLLPLPKGEGWGEGEPDVRTLRCMPVVGGSGVLPEEPDAFDRVVRLSLRVLQRSLAFFAVVLALAVGCALAAEEPGLVLTQVPPANSASLTNARNTLDVRYPEGSRVILARPPYAPDKVVVLSGGLRAAGSPFVACDGRRILFVGKAGRAGAWQIYEASASGGSPRALTDMPGGATDPALLSNGELVFVSPVPGLAGHGPNAPRPAVYAQGARGPARRLTFAPADVTDVTVLGDGRIMFVTALGTSSPASAQAVPCGLFTVNNDGTEFSLYAGQHERPMALRRPREIGKRIVYLASADQNGPDGFWGEAVRTARPFSQQERLFPFATGSCRSIDDGGDGTCLASLGRSAPTNSAARGSFAIFRLGTNSTSLGEPLFDDPAWDDLEASVLAPRPRPAGHISVMASASKTATLLCLDANQTSYRATNGETPKAATVRISLLGENGCTNWLGVVPVRDDGSFMAEVPADVALGFDTLDAQGQVLRSTPPVVWARGGENRICIGCHERHGRSPRNHRPLAVRFPTPHLTDTPDRVGRKPVMP
jgi:hypothetical protein